MSGKRYSPEEIISKLREAVISLAQRVKDNEVMRRLGVMTETDERWCKKHLGIQVFQAEDLIGLEKENTGLKHLLASTEFDKAI